MLKKQFLTICLSIIPTILCSDVIEISKDNFSKQIVKSKTPVILDVYATWCGPCRKMKPIFEEVSNEFTGKIVFAKMDFDKEPTLSQKLGVNVLPTFIIYHNGQVIQKVVGSQTKENLIKTLNELLNNI